MTLSQGMNNTVSSSMYYYSQQLNLSSSPEPMMRVEVQARAQKRRRSDDIHDDSFLQQRMTVAITNLSISNGATQRMEDIHYYNRRYVQAKRPRPITNGTAISIIPPVDSSLQHAMDDTTTIRRSNNGPTSSLEMSVAIQRLTNDMGRLDISSNSSTSIPLELQKESLGGLVAAMGCLNIIDEDADDDGDRIMTQASSLLDEPTYHFGVTEQTATAPAELSPTNKLRLHRQRRQQYLSKRQNKNKFRKTHH